MRSIDYGGCPPTPYEMWYWVTRIVCILQTIVPLAAAKQLGVLEERLRVAREKLIPKNPMAFNIRSYDDEKAVRDYEEQISAFMATPPVPDNPLKRD